jgi:hypothetical protein
METADIHEPITFETQSMQQQQQPQEQQPQQQSKKLYFKSSATEALHTAILLKARSPTSVASATVQTTFDTVSINSRQSNSATTQSSLGNFSKLPPKWTNASALLQANATSQSASGTPISVLASPLISNYSDELDSPLKINENIVASIRNLKPMLANLDPLRSSTSDDEESHTNTIERKFMHAKSATQELISSTSKASISPNVSVKNNNQQSSRGYLRTNSSSSYYGSYTKPSVINNRHSSSKTHMTNSSTVNTTPVRAVSRLMTTSGASSSLMHLQLSRLSNKRGKEEALSNSSSSDEEEQQLQSQQNQTSNHSQKLQQLLNDKTPSLLSSFHKSVKSANTSNLTHQPQITPVVSAAAAAAAAASNAAALSTTKTLGLFTNLSVTPSLLNSSSDSENITSPSSISSSSSSPLYSSSSSASSTSSTQSHKAGSFDNDLDSKYTGNLT